MPMTKSNIVMNKFMGKLNNIYLEKKTNNNFEIDEDFIDKQSQQYSVLLKSGIVNAAVDE